MNLQDSLCYFDVKIVKCTLNHIIKFTIYLTSTIFFSKGWYGTCNMAKTIHFENYYFLVFTIKSLRSQRFSNYANESNNGWMYQICSHVMKKKAWSYCLHFYLTDFLLHFSKIPVPHFLPQQL
jgi:hypothetical protein